MFAHIFYTHTCMCMCECMKRNIRIKWFISVGALSDTWTGAHFMNKYVCRYDKYTAFHKQMKILNYLFVAFSVL